MGRTLENQYLGPPKSLSRPQLLRRLWPGENNSGLVFGYLGMKEDLDEVIATDAKIMANAGLSADQIAGRTEELFLCDGDEFNGNSLIRREFIDSPVCPWRDYCTVSPLDLSLKVTEIIVLNGQRKAEAVQFVQDRGKDGLHCYPEMLAKDLGLVFSDLHPHLIREHHFFEGLATPYRLDPLRTARYLGLLPGGVHL